MFGSTVEEYGGLNTNVVDRRIVHGGRTTRQIHSIWETAHLLSSQGQRVPTNVESDTFKTWFKKHVLPIHPEETPSGFYKLIRKISSELKAGPIRYFELLSDGFWTGPLPKARERGTAMFGIRKPRREWERTHGHLG